MRARAAEQPRRGRRLRAARPRPSSSPPAASAATTSSCAATGRSGSGDAAAAHDLRRARRTSTGGCSASPRRAGAQRDQPRTGCGTTPRASRTGTRSGRSTASASCPGPSSLWLDATGQRLPVPLFPGFDTLGTLEHIMRTGYDHTWFVLTQKIIEKEFALSGSEQNPDLTGQERAQAARDARARGAPAPVEAFKEQGADFVVERDLRELVDGMNALTGEPLLDLAQVRARGRSPATARSTTRSARTLQVDRDPRRAQLPRRQADPRGDAAPAARPGRRAADRASSCTS